MFTNESKIDVNEPVFVLTRYATTNKEDLNWCRTIGKFLGKLHIFNFDVATDSENGTIGVMFNATDDQLSKLNETSNLQVQHVYENFIFLVGRLYV